MTSHKALREEWRQRLEEWKTSGLSGAEFCRQHELRSRRFYKWRKKLGYVSSSSPASGPAFVPVSFADGGTPGGSGIAVLFPRGIRLELGRVLDSAELVRAVEVLRRSH